MEEKEKLTRGTGAEIRIVLQGALAASPFSSLCGSSDEFINFPILLYGTGHITISILSVETRRHKFDVTSLKPHN